MHGVLERRMKKLDGGFRDTESSKKRRNIVDVGEATFCFQIARGASAAPASTELYSAGGEEAEFLKRVPLYA